MTSVDRRSGVSGNLGIKTPCRVVATTNKTLSALQTIDSVVLVADDRVLLTGQSTASQNGIWVASSGNWTRAKDFDGAYDVVRGTLFFVSSGTINAATLWRTATADPITIDTTSLTITQLIISTIDVQPHDADLDAISALSTTGVGVRTGSGTWTTRTITGTAAEITVTNGDGVSGNPTLSLPSALTFTGKTVTGGTFIAPTMGVIGSVLGLIDFAGSIASSTRLQAAVSAGGTLTLPAANDTLVGKATSDILTNKTIDTAGTNTIKVNGNTLAASSGTATITFFNSSDTVVGRATTDTLTNKTINGASNTLTVLAASQLSGQVPVANGGTGIASGASGGIPYFSGSTTIASSGALTQFGPVYGGGAGATPVAMAAGTDGQLIVGQTSSAPLWKTVTGDVTITAAGVTAVGSNKITDGMLRTSAALSVIGRSASSTGNVADIAGTAGQVLRVNSAGTSVGFGTIALSNSDSVTGTLGTINGGTGLVGYSQGDLIYASAANTLTTLAKSASSTRYLSNTGTTNNPAWAQIDLTTGVTGALPVANGGTAGTTAALARSSTGLNVDGYTPRGDANYTILATDRVVGTNASFSAARTWTLPAASAVNAGQSLIVADFANGVTGVNTLAIQRAGSDTVNGASSVTISTGNGGYAFWSDGSTKWTAQALGSAAVTGVSSFNGRTGAVVPTVGDYTESVWSNTRLAKTANYTVANTDKAKTLALGGSAFFTLTLSAASGYDANFAIVVENEDATRGKRISPSGLTSFILWPNQVVRIFNQNNVWILDPPQKQWRPSSAVTLNVDPVNGLSTNDGLSTGAGGAMATIQQAVDIVIKYIDIALCGAVLIQLVDGTYTSGANITSPPRGSTTWLTLQGNTTTPGNVIISIASGSCITVQDYAGVNITGMRLQASSGSVNGINAKAFALIDFSLVEFGAVGAAGQHIIMTENCVISAVGNYAITGDALVHCNINNNSIFDMSSATITLGSARAFTYFVLANQYAIISGTPTFAGAGLGAGSTGQRFLSIDSFVTQTVTMPGNAAGVATFTLGAASQAQQEAGSSVDTIVTPGRQQFHPSAAKAWAYITVSGGTPTLTANYNITGIADTAVGRVTVTIATDFSSANWCSVNSSVDAANNLSGDYWTSKAAGAIELRHADKADALADPLEYDFVGFGDQ